MTKIKDVINYLETIAPLAYQEQYDNCGLLTGSEEDLVSGVLITLDCTEEVVKEAINRKCNLIVTHHPIIFSGLKKITGKTYVERTVIRAIKNDIAIYAIHTNLDNILTGVNFQFAQHLELENLSILSPKSTTLNKLVCFVPKASKEKVLKSLYSAGAGNIGNYSNCSFTSDGTGSFTPNETATPSIGSAGNAEQVEETRVEVLFPAHKVKGVIEAMKASHPYEEIAHFITELNNTNQHIGAGIIGTLKTSLSKEEFLSHVKQQLNLSMIKFTKEYIGKVKTVAICGGSGSFLLPNAIRAHADAYISADFKYHEFFDAENKLMICDIGHYESEVATKDLLYDILSKKFSSFALNLSEIDTNPISYYN
ncbi:MAG: Nif3-like dinuclear metal center hexameric protein [Cyclobacteriaceae bacterium]|nr:Nif3-like dinuclear metal center hexameric protein [Cyclobacteriaceae bacterium]